MGYIENKNKEKRANTEIAKKQLLINYLLNPCYSAIIQKNNGEEVTHEELFRQSGSVIYDASIQGLENLMQSLNKRSRNSRVQIKDSEKIFQGNRQELIERIKYLSQFNYSKDKKIHYELPVIVYKASGQNFDAPTASNILSLGVLFNTTVRLFYEKDSKMETAEKLLSEANSYFMKKNNKYLAFTEESSEELDELLKNHYYENKFAKNI